MKRILIALLALIQTAALRADDPRLSSWFTARSGRYARIYPTLAAQNAQVPVTTWSRGAGMQNLPTYSGVHKVMYSANWVYIRTTGLASHIMGPWYLNAAQTQLFPNYPSNTATIYRIPRNPVVPATKVNTGNGAIGFFVNGVAFFDNRDTFSYSNANGRDADPMAGIGLGDGIWNRDAYPNELVTFDAALAHQAGNQYHYHVQPIALRFQLGDHVKYNPITNRYSESTVPATRHSPIIAWAADGFPVYGPYGYSNPTDPASGVRRMISGYVLRDGQFSTTNLNATGRRSLPLWAAIAQNRSQTLNANQYGPNVSATYVLGHYLEDNDYLGDLGFTQGNGFDLDRYNGRFCLTPEFPEGTYAYFSALNVDYSPAFPYNVGRQFYGTPSGGTVASITEAVTTQFHGGPSNVETAGAPSINSSTSDVTLVWSAVEGGSYRVENSSQLTTWTAFTPNVVATDDSAQRIDNGAATTNVQRFYRLSRTSLAPFDTNGFDYP